MVLWQSFFVLRIHAPATYVYNVVEIIPMKVTTRKSTRKRRLQDSNAVENIEDSTEAPGGSRHDETALELASPVAAISSLRHKAAAGHRKLLSRVEAATIDERKVAHFFSYWSDIKEMRKERNAPVDTMGCDRQGFAATTDVLRRFHHLTACFLSSRTTDQANSGASIISVHGTITNFRFNAKPYCYLRRRRIGSSFAGCRVPQYQSEVSSALPNPLQERGCRKNYVSSIVIRRNLKKIAQFLLEHHGGDIPTTYDEIVALPGIGPKMAFILMEVAFGRTLGIAVDIHVHRIANRLGLVKTSSPEDTCVELAAVVPKEYWCEVNEILVGFGQQICLPRHPKCTICLVSDRCPASSAKPKKILKYEEAKVPENEPGVDGMDGMDGTDEEKKEVPGEKQIDNEITAAAILNTFTFMPD